MSLIKSLATAALTVTLSLSLVACDVGGIFSRGQDSLSVDVPGSRGGGDGSGSRSDGGLLTDFLERSGGGGGGGQHGAGDKELIRDAARRLPYLNVSTTSFVPGRDPEYRRDAFGSAWTDNHTAELGGNGCDTRNDILNRDLTDVRHSDDRGCVVITGTLVDDRYTGKTISFRRGQATSGAVQIDHVVALKNAWISGAHAWSDLERTTFANDPVNLLAVDGPANASKGDRAADQWMVPQNPDYRCAYAARQIHVKLSYGLSVTPSEHAALEKAIDDC